MIPGCDGPNPEFAPSWVLNAIPASGNSFDGCERFINTSAVVAPEGTCPADQFDSSRTQNCEAHIYENQLSVVYDVSLQTIFIFDSVAFDHHLT